MAGKGKNFNPQGAIFGPKPPCGKDCAERNAGCSVTCEKWRAYIVERNAYYEKKNAERDLRDGTHGNRKATARYAYKKKSAPGYH